MKVSSLVALIAIFGCCGLALHAQTTKVGVIDTDAFADEKDGIKRLVVAFKQVSDEFKGKRDELVALRAKYDALVKTINDTQKVADQKTLQTQADQAETIKQDIQRKQEDGQKALEKRSNEVTGPIYQDIGDELRTFAKARGMDIVFDVSKMQGVVMVTNDAVNITAAFIADYNAKHASVPAGVPAKTP